jgi:hypothetical protein
MAGLVPAISFVAPPATAIANQRQNNTAAIWNRARQRNMAALRAASTRQITMSS